MKLILSRVTRASVIADGIPGGSIGSGLLVYIGVFVGDTEATADTLAVKISKLRVFSDADDKLNLSLLDVGGEVMIIPNFTLCADTSRGNRPNYTSSAPRFEAERLCEYFVVSMRRCIGRDMVKTGVFGADMKIDATMDGPVTIEIGG